MLQNLTFTQNQTQQILRLFSKMMTRGWWHRLFTRLTHRNSNLLELNETLRCAEVENSYYAGLHTVDIDRIRGTEGKSDAFDGTFHPRQEKSRERWFGIMRERLNGQPLPPVELIDVDGTYYVRDGHHRISVARCLGESYVDAEVIVMDLNRRIR
jgi:hypothetical protein